MRWCGQMLAPPHSLHLLLMRWCGQMFDPPHSLHWLLMHWCWQMLDPPHSFNFLAIAPAALVRADARPPTLLACVPDALVRAQASRPLVRGVCPCCTGLTAALPFAGGGWGAPCRPGVHFFFVEKTRGAGGYTARKARRHPRLPPEGWKHKGVRTSICPTILMRSRHRGVRAIGTHAAPLGGETV